ncbi:hypothetical protein SARC_02725 [Sphaeroforma arctica JP610]|uniref:Uncharacterized protein n=1 Tax=Sphaeroforma arctica JP610 TaxID=667725 RepID=A0A0L0G845_9EUKA|nr:hypothetical protein SARC_02725 [Sphaeroforma arctica JP610]KNC85064.1 hypothetical protein SARC_02725 [Sphaeroforma arctica JP610]|eukprot:XP_014158966.1 hypothetical protein SARC_02725 [Sphaeroforma arctica JP610]
MKCCIGYDNLKDFGKALACLGRIADTIAFEFYTKSILVYCVSASQNAVAKFTFESDFFDIFTIEEEEVEDCVLRCKILSKTLTSIVRSLVLGDKTIETCTIRLSLEDPVLIFELGCRYGMTRLYKFNYEDVYPLKVSSYKATASSTITVDANIMSEGIGNFPANLTEVSFVVNRQRLRVKSFFDSTDSVKTSSNMLQTEFALAKSEFELYQVARPTTVTFCLKEVRAILQYCSVYRQLLTIYFDGAGRPITFVYEDGNHVQTEFVLSTLQMDDDEAEVNASPTGDRVPTSSESNILQSNTNSSNDDISEVPDSSRGRVNSPPQQIYRSAEGRRHSEREELRKMKGDRNEKRRQQQELSRREHSQGNEGGEGDMHAGREPISAGHGMSQYNPQVQKQADAHRQVSTACADFNMERSGDRAKLQRQYGDLRLSRTSAPKKNRDASHEGQGNSSGIMQIPSDAPESTRARARTPEQIVGGGDLSDHDLSPSSSYTMDDYMTRAYKNSQSSLAAHYPGYPGLSASRSQELDVGGSGFTIAPGVTPNVQGNLVSADCDKRDTGRIYTTMNMEEEGMRKETDVDQRRMYGANTARSYTAHTEASAQINTSDTSKVIGNQDVTTKNSNAQEGRSFATPMPIQRTGSASGQRVGAGAAIDGRYERGGRTISAGVGVDPGGGSVANTAAQAGKAGHMDGVGTHTSTSAHGNAQEFQYSHQSDASLSPTHGGNISVALGASPSSLIFASGTSHDVGMPSVGLSGGSLQKVSGGVTPSDHSFQRAFPLSTNNSMGQAAHSGRLQTEAPPSIAAHLSRQQGAGSGSSDPYALLGPMEDSASVGSGAHGSDHSSKTESSSSLAPTTQLLSGRNLDGSLIRNAADLQTGMRVEADVHRGTNMQNTSVVANMPQGQQQEQQEWSTSRGVDAGLDNDDERITETPPESPEPEERLHKRIKFKKRAFKVRRSTAGE